MKNQIRIAVLDDDRAEIHKTEQMISTYKEMHPEHEYIVACYMEAKTFMEAMYTGADTMEWVYDILLMDVYLPDGNGIKCGRKLRDKGFAGVIIYKSSAVENCLDALTVDAMQYLIKPVSEDKLFETMDQAVEKILTITKYASESSIYSEDPSVPIQTKEEKRRKPIRDFLTRWFHGDS